MNGFIYQSNVYRKKRVWNKFINELEDNFKFMGEKAPEYKVFVQEDGIGKHLEVWIPNQELCNLVAVSESALSEFELFEDSELA